MASLLGREWPSFHAGEKDCVKVHYLNVFSKTTVLLKFVGIWIFRRKKQGAAYDVSGALFTHFELLTSDKINA